MNSIAKLLTDPGWWFTVFVGVAAATAVNFSIKLWGRYRRRAKKIKDFLKENNELLFKTMMVHPELIAMDLANRVSSYILSYVSFAFSVYMLYEHRSEAPGFMLANVFAVIAGSSFAAATNRVSVTKRALRDYRIMRQLEYERREREKGQ
jgi:hypothetical protein